MRGTKFCMKKVVDFFRFLCYASPRKCASGGIGRLAGFRCRCSFRAWGFDSPLAHQRVVADFISFATTFFYKKSSLTHSVVPPLETLNKSPRTSCRRIFRPSALQKFEIHKVFPHFCALTGKKSARQYAHVDLFSASLSKSNPLRRDSIWFFISGVDFSLLNYIEKACIILSL